MELNWQLRSAQWMLVTPQIALNWLQHRNTKNRDKRGSKINQYAKDIAEGRWEDNGTPIQFDWFGQIINGQHRLEAIWATQVPIEVLVVTGLNPAVRATIDNHAKRSLVDAMMNDSELLGDGHTIQAKSAAGMWNAMRSGLSTAKGKMSHTEAIEFAKQHRDAGLFALAEFNRHKRVRAVVIAPVIAAVARAYYHYADKAKLARFVEVLSTGIQRTPDDRTIIALREALIGRSERGLNSNANADVYGKTARTIQAWMHDITLSKIYAPSAEPFPLPDRPANAAPPVGAHRMADDGGRLQRRKQADDLLAPSAH